MLVHITYHNIFRGIQSRPYHLARLPIIFPRHYYSFNLIKLLLALQISAFQCACYHALEGQAMTARISGLTQDAKFGGIAGYLFY